MAGARRYEANQDRSAEQDQGLVKSLSTGGAWATTGAEVDRTGLVGNKGDASHSHLCETILQDGFDLKQYESRLLELAVQRVGGQSHPCSETAGDYAAAVGVSVEVGGELVSAAAFGMSECL